MNSGMRLGQTSPVMVNAGFGCDVALAVHPLVEDASTPGWLGRRAQRRVSAFGGGERGNRRSPKTTRR
jgi:hypothetical protein